MSAASGDVAWLWLNGALVPAGEARVSPFDHGLLVGDGVFETLRVYGGVPFAVRRHLERLAASAGGLGLAVPPLDWRGVIADVIAANDVADGRLRITLTGGIAPLGSDRGEGSETTVIVAAGPMVPWPEVTDVVVVPWPRNERSAVAGLKTTSYAENVVALAWARERGAGEALFANTRGELCEGTGSNVFVRFGDTVVTPPLTSGCLGGVTRALLLELGEGVEDVVPVELLVDADEIFLTSSTREVQAARLAGTVGQVGTMGHPDAPGPAATAATAAFRHLLARTMDP